MNAVYLNENHYQQLNDNYVHLELLFSDLRPAGGEIQSKFGYKILGEVSQESPNSCMF